MKRDREKPTVIDPVCGMKLSPDTAAETCEHEGTTYYFCADVCRETFVADPQRYTQQRQQGEPRP